MGKMRTERTRKEAQEEKKGEGNTKKKDKDPKWPAARRLEGAKQGMKEREKEERRLNTSGRAGGLRPALLTLCAISSWCVFFFNYGVFEIANKGSRLAMESRRAAVGARHRNARNGTHPAGICGGYATHIARCIPTIFGPCVVRGCSTRRISDYRCLVSEIKLCKESAFEAESGVVANSRVSLVDVCAVLFEFLFFLYVVLFFLLVVLVAFIGIVRGVVFFSFVCRIDFRCRHTESFDDWETHRSTAKVQQKVSKQGEHGGFRPVLLPSFSSRYVIFFCRFVNLVCMFFVVWDSGCLIDVARSERCAPIRSTPSWSRVSSPRSKKKHRVGFCGDMESENERTRAFSKRCRPGKRQSFRILSVSLLPFFLAGTKGLQLFLAPAEISLVVF
jgi:hypothetical protein